MLTVRGVSYLVDGTEPADLDRDLGMISEKLHCNAVMLISGDVDRLIGCARSALKLGLAVHLRPDATDLRPEEMLRRLADVAEHAEALRVEYPDQVTLFVGSEFSHTVRGIIPGPRSFIRLRLVLRFRSLLRGRVRRRVNALLTRASTVARQTFTGPLCYSAAAWEDVDWSVFDLAGVSLYRSLGNRDNYSERVRALAADHGRPFLITEFGCGAFVGADDRGAAPFQIVNWFTDPPRIRGDLARDESVQAAYLAELIDLYDAEDVHGCFVFTYTMPGYPHSSDPARDLDKAGFGLVTNDEDDGAVRCKQAFHAVAERYSTLGSER
jgi:hypothetical protein